MIYGVGSARVCAPLGSVGGIGGGGGSPAVLRPNIEYIINLRGNRPYPPELNRSINDFPSQITGIALIDDSRDITTGIARTIRRIFGRGLEIIDVDKDCKRSDAAAIYAANFQDQIAMMVPDFFESHGINFTFTDFNMFDINGAEITRRLRQKGHKGIIVGMSGETASGEGTSISQETFYKEGVDAFFEKPFDASITKNLFSSG